MKIDRHSLRIYSTGVKLRRCRDETRYLRRTCWLIILWFGLWISGQATAEDRVAATADQLPHTSVSQSPPPALKKPQNPPAVSQPQAVNLLLRVLGVIVNGPAFDAKVRETVWVTGREVVGVGTYEQAGGGSGRYNLQVTMHDGDGKHRLQQISDGRLAWTRTEIAGTVSHRRVDVGRLDEWVQGAAGQSPISPGLKVGAWAEMLSTIERDYVLSVDSAHLKGEAMWVITGKLRQDRRDQIIADSHRQEWPLLHPTLVRVAVKRNPDPETGFGQLLPVHIEFRSDPVASGEVAGKSSRRLITLIELYSIRSISPPPAERFRFENHDAEVIINETDRYIQLYGVRLTDHQRRQLRR
jgi:hypothetical protein